MEIGKPAVKSANGANLKKDRYAEAGVDRGGADLFVEKIQALTRSTLNAKVKAQVGGYASLYALDTKRWIAASTDGVGTKLKLAFELDRHDTVGIDLVAMSVNDLLCVGAEPLFFLDYFATGKLDRRIGEAVVRGIVVGCRDAGCALVGGETAEMPDFYATGEYDLAGFAVGQVNPKDVLPSRSRKIKPGDVLIGLASSGFHSNGYSLIRKLLLETGADRAHKERALTPTKIYVRALAPLLAKGWIKGLAHITGSGFLNVPRMSTVVNYEIRLPELADLPSGSSELWTWLDQTSRLSLQEQAETFNCGIGMVIACDPKRAPAILQHFKKVKEPAWILGKTLRKTPRTAAGKCRVEMLRGDQPRVVLEY